MDLYTTISILIVVTAIFGYINHRFIKLPPSIGLMLLALITSFFLIGVGMLYPTAIQGIKAVMNTIDFTELLMGSMLSFMLFAGAIHINMNLLKQERVSVILFSTFSVVISTFIIGTTIYYLLSLFDVPTKYIYCLLFGSLISPTDPIAVLGILKEAKISKSLEMKLAGESLFNDGVAVVVFLTILHVANQPTSIVFSDVALLFIQEAFGGILLGISIGYMGFI